jgi:hypothetical protein
MDFIFELLGRMALKSGLRTLFRTPPAEWGALQWGIVLGLVALAGAAAYFFFRHGKTSFGPLGRRKRRRF